MLRASDTILHYLSRVIVQKRSQYRKDEFIIIVTKKIDYSRYPYNRNW